MENKNTFTDVFLMTSGILRAMNALHLSFTRANCEISISPYSITCTSVFSDGGVHVGQIFHRHNDVCISASPEDILISCNINDPIDSYIGNLPAFLANIIREFAAEDPELPTDDSDDTSDDLPNEDDSDDVNEEINWDDEDDLDMVTHAFSCNDLFNGLLEFHQAGWPDVITDAKFGHSGTHVFHEIKFTDDGQVMISIYENDQPLINLYSSGKPEQRSFKSWIYDKGNWIPGSPIDAKFHVSMFDWLSKTLSVDIAHFCMNGFVNDIPDDYDEETRKSLDDAMNAAMARVNESIADDEEEDEDFDGYNPNDYEYNPRRAHDIINTILSEDPQNSKHDGKSTVTKYMTSQGVTTVTVKEQFILIEYRSCIFGIDTKITGLLVIAEDMVHCNVFLNDEKTPSASWDFDVNACIHAGAGILENSFNLDYVLNDIMKRDVIKPYDDSKATMGYTLNDLRQAFCDCAIFYSDNSSDDNRIFIAPNAYFTGKPIQERYEIMRLTDDGGSHQLAVISFDDESCSITIDDKKSNFNLSKRYKLMGVFNMTGKVDGFDSMMNAVCELANAINKKGGDESGV